jgi:diaminohydroxyphosphoribosylaminopyrimidine deaminase/5-amino-6-(5-phosphoribosylamino)uracil reductase
MCVTLEPCRHHGKTPPCTDALIRAGVGRVVVAVEDPDENVAGRGLAKLREAGIEVALGVCEDEARTLLREYFTLRKKRRPWVVGKWAQTSDHFLALPEGSGRWISGDESRLRAHELRSVCDGILVGVETVLADDPRLTNRSGVGRQPTRVILDANLRTPLHAHVIRTAGETPTIIVTSHDALAAKAQAASALKKRGVELLPLAASPGDAPRVDLDSLLAELGRRRWTRLLVEGGPTVLRSFLEANLADELWVFTAPRTLGRAGTGLPNLDIADAPPETLRREAEENIGSDVLRRYAVMRNE